MQSGAFVGRQEAARRGAAVQRAAALGLVLLAIGLVLIGLYLFVPRAVVVLHPRTQLLVTTVELRIDPAVTPGTSPAVPARTAVTVVEVSEEVPVEGRRPAPDARAVGTITLVNRAGGEATVPIGTVVMTPSGARFQTTAEATLGPDAGSTARVGVQALDPGEIGNVARLEISRVLGGLGTRPEVLNEEPTSGGGQSATPMVTAEDRARVRTLALDRARFDGIRALEAELGEGDRLVGETLRVALSDERLDGEVGDAATVLRYRARARISATVFAQAQVERAARAAWRPTAPVGYFVPPSEVQVDGLETVRVDGEALTVRAPLRVVAAAEMDANEIRERVRGRSPDAARRELARTLPLEGEPRVRIEPSWIGLAPWRVEVVLDLNAPVARRD
ncbi:MAG TPA: baseplate J/gp47 family protein [Chloroflexota bacterium]